MQRLLPLCLALAASAQVEAPRIGCFSTDDRAFEILGVPGSFVARPAEACKPVESPWRISSQHGDAWLERLAAPDDAVELRRKLDPGDWAVFPDGSLVQLDALHLPGPVSHWRAVAPGWLLILTPDAALLLHNDGQWFYLPGAPDPGATAK